METVAIAGRLAQFAGAAMLFGWPLFRLYASPASTEAAGRTRAILTGSAAAVILGAVVSLMGQAAAMTGAAEAAFQPAVWWDVLSATVYGHGLMARLVLAVAALAVAAAGLNRKAGWIALAVLGGGVAASFAWTGHAAAGDGAAALAYRIADILHLLAAAAWIGALTPLALAVMDGLRAPNPDAATGAARALRRFSGVGPAIVALLVATGLVNSWRLIGLEEAWRLTASPYGRALLIKLGLFGLMAGLAAANRFVLSPGLDRTVAGDPRQALRRLRLSLLAETALGLGVLAVVSVLGVLAPPSSP